MFKNGNNMSLDDVDVIGHRRKPLEKVYISKQQEEKPRCKKNFPQYNKPCNILFHNYQSNQSTLHKPFMKTNVR